MAWVLRPAQQRQQVLDVRGFEELQAAELEVGDVASHQFQLERGAVVRGAEQHGLTFQRDALFALREHLVGHPGGLLGVVEQADQRRALAGASFAPQRLRKALGRLGDQCVAGLQNRLGRAVVALQRQHRSGRVEGLGEIEDVAHFGGAEGVDRLGVVADHTQATAVGFQCQQDAGLQAVGVLVLVDEHMAETRAELRRQRLILQHLPPGQQQIVVVEHALALLLRRVGAEQRLQLGLPLSAPGEALLQHLAQRLAAVDRARIDGQAGALQREALVRARQALLLAQQAEQVFAVAAVGDGEGRVQADALGLLAQQPRADAVEGAGPGQLGRALRGAEAQRQVQHAADTALQVLRRAAREAKQQQPPRVGAVEHQPRDTGRQRQRLARACAGDDQQRRIAVAAMEHRLALLVVELRERFGARRSGAWAGGAEGAHRGAVEPNRDCIGIQKDGGAGLKRRPSHPSAGVRSDFWNRAWC